MGIDLAGRTRREASSTRERGRCKSSKWRELAAIALSLKSSASMMRNKVFLVETDNNSTTKAYIYHMGERAVMLSAIAHEI